MNEIQLTLSIDEINLIIDQLGSLPFSKVYKLIEKIHIQANQQTKQEDDNQS